MKTILIKNGTYNSHGAILARLWNIPALVGITPDEDWADHPAVMDADQGILYLDPDDATREMARNYSPFWAQEDLL